ncbi:MAG: hypothetical protein P1V18_02895 [Candidatus Gracilibacteria bacterium]|nr:hypothetical protein [Candidatus Gracilibacteria bacterium]
MVGTFFGLNGDIHGPLLAQVNTGILPIIEGYEPVSLIKEAIAWSIILAAILCIVFIFIGGISFILSGGQDEKITAAVSTIRYAIIGLVIVILSVTMVNVITFIFKVPFDVVNYREILSKVQSLSQLFQQDSFYDSGGDYYDGGL